MTGQVKSLLRAILPRAIRPRVLLAGLLRGCRIATSWHDYPAAITGRTERPLIDRFAENVKPGDTWLDIGAHYGHTAMALSRLVGASGRVLAFEPMISTAGYVTQTRELNKFPQLIVFPLGLASPETSEMVQLPVTRGMVDSTLGKGEACPRRSRRSGREKVKAVWQEAIMVARFDWLWGRICGGQERIDGITIDVQGMEIEVLQGRAETLRQQEPKLVVELHRGVDREELLGLIEAAGYVRQAEIWEACTPWRCASSASVASW
jgi:FkbM family methyltransferase